MTETDCTSTARSSRLKTVASIGVGIALLCFGIYALSHMLRHTNVAEVLAQMHATPSHILGLSVLATALGYAALVGYDWWALDYLGKRLPVRVVALGGFMGYAFGNTIGISVLSGGAVRYRIYSAFGLNALDVAAIASYIALAMGFGLSLIGLGALALHPAALGGIVPLSPGTVRVLAVLATCGTIGMLLWLSITQRCLRIRKYTISMPRPRVLAGQLFVAFFDTVMAAAALYVLLPSGTPPFTTFLAIYATATMVGILSHVPGGVGVFETVVIAAMPRDVPVSEVAAALLLFRIIYYLLPFAIAFVMLSLNEARLAGGMAARLFGDTSEQVSAITRSVSGAVPLLSGLWALGFGIWLVAVATMPEVRLHTESDDLAAQIVQEGGLNLTLGIGLVLLALSAGLFRRKTGAFWLTIFAIIAGIGALLLRDADLQNALILTFGVVALLPFRHEFDRNALGEDKPLSPSGLARMASVIFAPRSWSSRSRRKSLWARASRRLRVLRPNGRRTDER